jgi:hypothetical protein
MAAAVDAAEERKALDAKITYVEKELQGASGDEKVALQQRLTALEQQKLLLMQQQSGATSRAHSQGASWWPTFHFVHKYSTDSFTSEQGCSRTGLQDDAVAATWCPEAVAAAGSIAAGSMLQGCMIMWCNLQTQHCILLLVNQPGIHAAAVFSCQDCQKHQHLATCQLPQVHHACGGIGFD